jgi:sialic acid synthase SpsE
MRTIEVGNKKIGEGNPTYIVAEAGVNHNGDIELAKRHIREAHLAGADAIKFQIYKAEKLVTQSAPIYWKVGNDEGKTQYEVFSKIHNFPIEFYRACIEYANEIGITFFCTPFDLEAVDVMEKIGVKLYKVASGDITYHQLLKKIAQTDKPIILSTGASTIGEIEEAVNIIEKEGNNQIILLHCTLAYPTPQKDINLNMIPILARLFQQYPIGLSDHTFDPFTPALAVMLGAKIIEKHFTVDKNLEGSSDHKLGVDPFQMKQLVESVRLAEKSLGQELKRADEAEHPALLMARRSVVSAKNIKKGTKITKEMLTCKRPGTGIPPKFLEILIGRSPKKDILEDTTLTWEMF